MTSQEVSAPTGSTSSDAASDTESNVDRARHLSRLLADRIIAIANPETVLVVGCGRGLLVQALADKGVDAHGIDESDDKISAAPVDVRPRLEVASPTKPLGGRYDVVTCLDVLAALDPADAQAGLDSICAATDRIVFAATPGAGSAHASLFAPSDWMAAFAERGFFRRTDVTLDFWTPWTTLFERADLQPRDIVHRYEMSLGSLEAEVREKRAALAAADGQTSQRHADLTDQLTRAQHQVLTTRDHIIGLEAEAAQLQSQVERLNKRLIATQERSKKLRDRLHTTRRRATRAERKLAAMTGSRAWRIGTLLTGSRRAKR
ncbi:methyltransferase domain-containing protein [Nocardioides sp. LHG3406-4]|uniref:class I SAM-dependent methyltransferase n=1 Tax=Nocardioides sp. LHG3406-4 TaxID=2804575 RepID=UPI003CF6D824